MSKQMVNAEQVVRELLALMARRTELYNAAVANTEKMFEIMQLLHDNIDTVAPSGELYLRNHAPPRYDFRMNSEGWTILTHRELKGYKDTTKASKYTVKWVEEAMKAREASDKWLLECSAAFSTGLLTWMTDLKQRVTDRENLLRSANTVLIELRDLLGPAPAP